jgi:hypothetical protein
MLTAEKAEPIESAEANEPIEPAEQADPTEPIENTEPIEPIENTESWLQSEKTEFVDPIDVLTRPRLPPTRANRWLARAQLLTTPLAPPGRRPPRRATRTRRPCRPSSRTG